MHRSVVVARKKECPKHSTNQFVELVTDKQTEDYKQLPVTKQHLVDIRSKRGANSRLSAADWNAEPKVQVTSNDQSGEVVYDPDDIFLERESFRSKRGYYPEQVGMECEWHQRNNGTARH